MRIVIAGDEILRYVDWLRAIAALPGERQPRLHFGARARDAALSDAADAATQCLILCGRSLDGAAASLPALTATNTGLRAIALVDAARIALVGPLIAAGVTAAFALDAPMSPEQRADALRLALSGVRLVDPGLLAPESVDVAQRAIQVPRSVFGPLSHRQREVVSLLASGASNKQIARALSLSEATVKSHLSSTMRRLGFNSRVHLALAAAREGAAPG
jgi:DNA-binding NarL/FixJ family response regulator